LLEAVSRLWETGKRELRGNIPDQNPSIKQLCALVHAVHITCNSIIASHDSGEILSDVGEKLGNILKDLESMRGGSLAYNEIMFLRLARNECIGGLWTIAQKNGEMVSDELLLEMYENTFWLQSFDCGRLPKGCSAVIYGLIPSLAPYWRQHPDQAQRIATAVYDSLVSSAGKVNGSDLKPVPDQIGQFEAPDGHHVDLISFRVYDSGNRVANAKEVFLHGDYERLFGDKAQKIVSTGNSHRFVDSDGYGDIVMLVLGGKDSKIYRKFEGSDDRWCYVSLDKISTVSLPRCFGGDDFTTWVDANGRFKICAKERPNEVLYESDEQGRLCDVIRREQGTVPYYISFDIPSQNDIFSRFEGTTYSLFYHDGNGVIQEIMLPRYHGKTGKPLRFHRDGENWVLHSNPSYQLIDAPSWSIGGEETKQNLLLGYEGALCLKNTDPKNGGAFKYLLPQHDISRSRGMTHQLTSCPPKTDCKSKFFSGARYAEVNLPTNDLDFIAPSLQETDGLSCLRLARIFQAQGEYGLAVQYLDKISSHGQFDGDEINALNSIIQGFKNGKEGSGLAALVPLKALSCLLRSSPFGTDSEEILNSLLENLAGVKPPLLECLVEQYLGDFDLQPKELRLNPQEELTLWHNVLALANPIVQRKEARERYNYNARFIEKVKSPIVARIDDLCRLKNPNSASLIKFTGIEIGNLKVIIERERPYFMRFARESVKAMEGIASKIRSKDFSFKGLDSIRALEQQIDVENNEFKNIKPAVDKVSEAIQLHIKNLSEVNSFKIKYLSNDAKEHVRQLLGQLSEQLDNFKEKAGKHLNDLQFLEQLKRLKALRREDMPLREAAQIEVGEGDAFDSLTSSMESALHGALLTLESSIFERSTGVPTGEAPKLDDLALSEEDKKQFGSRAVAFLEEFNGELAVGARQLQEISADPVASAVPEVGEISELLATANAQRSRAIKFAQSAARRIAEIGNRKRLETTHGADAWEPVKIPHALRAYGIFVSGGADGSKRALEYLQHAHPWFSAGKLHDFLLCTEAYLVSVNSARHLERVSAALAPLEEDGVPADSRAASWRDALPLLRQTRNDVVRNDGDNGLVGNMLLFEYMTGIRPREDQIEKMASIVNALVRGGDQHGALIQQIMGSGKTKVLLPFLIALLLNGQDNFPMIVSHISQLPAVMMELPAILGRIGIRLDLIDVDYSQFFNPEMIRALRQQLETAFAERNSVPVIASHTLLALRTAFRTLSEQTGSKESATTNDLYVEFNELFSFMEQKGIALMDEVHITLNPKESFIIQPPAVAKLDAKIAEKDVTSMVDIIYDLPRNLIAPIASNKQDQISPASLKNELRAHAAVTCGEQFGVPGSLRDAFAGFICGDFDGQEEAALPEDVRQWLDNLAPATKHRVCLLRKLCSSTLPQCLTKVYGEHYGYNDRGEVVPYRNRMPTNNHYKDPHEALCYYILATTTKGVPDITLGQWVGNLAKQGKEQVGSDMPFAQTNQAVLFERLFDGMDPRLSLLDAVDMQTSLGCPQTREGVLQSLQSFLGANPDKKKILAAELAQDQAGYFPRSYETTPLDISTVFHGTVSMSGTLSNRESYTRKVSSAVDLQRGALGKVACKLIQDSAAPNAAQPPKTQIVALPEATLDTVAGTLAGWKETVDDSKVKNLRIIVDYGAQFKDQPARQSVKNIADFIADSGNGAKYIEYFDPQLNGFAIVSVEDVCRDGLSFKAKKITNPVSDRPTESEELLTFLDTPHTTGTDPLMMLNGHGLTTLNVLQNDLDGFLQAVMRERKFLHANGQTMDIVLSEKAVQDVFSDGNVPAMPALIGRLARNTAASINRQQIQAATLQLRELPRRFIENKLRKCAASKNLKDLAKWRAATAELVASIDDFDVDSWGNARSWQSVRTILENQWAHTLGRLRNALSSLGDIAGEALAEIPALNSEGKAYIDAIREDAKILAFSRQGAVAVSDQEIQVEVQQQQQQQQEQELQLEMQLLHQILRGDANRRACAETALAHPAAPTPAWNVIGDWQGQSVAARLSTDHHRIGALPGKLRERYDDARSVFSSLSEEFSATRNFWETATTPESIFSPYQKSAKYLLLSWDNSTPPQNRCHFLSEYEAASVQKMIDDGSLTECHLCTATGSTLSQRGALKEGSEAFKEQALWVAHFFNGDTHWLETHPITTIEMFNRFGMPQAYQAEGNGERNKFLENIRHFLMLRSSDPKRTDAACKASLLLSTGQQRDLLASFLAEHALTERTSPHTIFSAIVDSFNDFNAAHNLPHWSIILLSALDKFDPHALINNQNFGTLLSQISGTQIFPTIKAAIDRIPHHRGSGS
jgi:hypothetical protein